MKKILISMLTIAAAGQMAMATSVSAKYLGVNSNGRKTAMIHYVDGADTKHVNVYVGESRFEIAKSESPLGDWMYAQESGDDLIVRHAYCIDVFQEIHTNDADTWTLGDLTTAPDSQPMSELQALQLTWLYNTALPDPDETSWDFGNAWQFQLAVWEIATGAPDYNLGSGDFRTDRSASMAQDWLSDIAANYSELSDFDGLQMDTVLAMVNDGTQDFMVGFESSDGPPNPVPEPMTMLSAGFGLAAVGRYLRKRRRA